MFRLEVPDRTRSAVINLNRFGPNLRPRQVSGVVVGGLVERRRFHDRIRTTVSPTVDRTASTFPVWEQISALPRGLIMIQRLDP